MGVPGRWAGPMLLAAGLAGCKPAAPPAAAIQPRYVVGGAYQAGGIWYYPKEQLTYDATGLASIAPDRPGLTATGQPFDQAAVAAAHQTLQLPAVARVTNLENGRQLLVRLNDRGPANPARLLQLTRRAGGLLGIAPGGVGRIRVQLEPALSQRLASAAGGGPAIQVSAAPRGAVQAEALAPPSGIEQARSVRSAAVSNPTQSSASLSAASIGGDEAAGQGSALSETVQTVSPAPGQLWVQAGEFGRRQYAEQLRAKLAGIGASVSSERRGRDERFRVRAGPFATVGQADSALDRAVRTGVTDARIVVEP